MKKLATSLLSIFGLVMPSLMRADCVPSAPVGYTVPFSMVSLKNFSSGGSQYASYVSGTLTYNSHDTFFSGTTLSGSGLAQLFSDRLLSLGCTGLACTNQPFNVKNFDQLGVSISDGELLIFPPKPSAISVTLTLQSWGNATETFTGTCDATSGELSITSAQNMYLMTFGTPQAPPTAPK